MSEGDVKPEIEDVEQPKAEPSIAHEDEGVNGSEHAEEPQPAANEREGASHHRVESPSNGTHSEIQRAVFVGNFPPTFSSEDIEQLFVKHGEVARVDKKQNFAFVFMVNASDAESAIAELGGKAIGRPPRTLRVEWSRGDGAVRRREVARRSRSLPPNETLFVVNYDPEKVAQKDLEELFKVHGRIVRIELHGQFTFVQYETVEMATSALNSLNGQMFKNRSLIVEYTIRKDSMPRGRFSSSGRLPESGSRGYGARSMYGMANHMNGGYGGHGMYGGYNRGNYGAPPYSMPAHANVSAGGEYRYDQRSRYPSRTTGSRRRDDDYGWSAALSDRRSKRALSPRRSLSPRREGEIPRKERKLRSRSLSRSRSPSRSRGRSRRDRSRSPSPKKRRTSKDNSSERHARSRSRSRSRSPNRRNRSDTRSASRSRSSDRGHSPGGKDQDSPRAEVASFEDRRRSHSRSRSPTPEGHKHDTLLPSTVPAGP